MTTLINNNTFLLLLIIGGLLVGIRAHELYSTPSPRNDAQWLIDEMNLRFLTSHRQFATGFVFYLIPILLLYTLLSVSPEILSLSMGIAGTTNSVGALTLSDSDVNTFAPMLAATAVITLLSVKPFSLLEHGIRRASHGIAGIPQHVQDIIRQIRQMDFRDSTASSTLPRLQVDNVKAIPGLDNDLVAIETLDEWIFGATGHLIWSDKANHALQLARQRILGEHNALKRKLVLRNAENGNGSSDGDALSDEALEAIVRQARELRIQYTRLLAVLVANQDERLPKSVASRPLWDLVLRAQRKRTSSRHINILATSTLVGVVLGTLLASLFNFTVYLAHEMSMQYAQLDMQTSALYIAGLSTAEFYWSALRYSVQTAWWDVIGTGLIFFTGCTAGLIYRASRVNSAEWEYWHIRSHPVFQYLVIAILACISSALFYEVFLFIKLVVWPSLHVRNAGHFASMLQDFGSDYLVFGLLCLLAAPSAIMVCRLSDNFGSIRAYDSLWRDSWIRTLAWSVGLISMLLYLVIRQWIGEIHAMPDVLISLVVPAGTLFIMSAAYWRIGESSPAPEIEDFEYARPVPIVKNRQAAARQADVESTR